MKKSFPYRPGLTGLVNSNKIDNFFGPDFHIQAVRIKNESPDHAKAGYGALLEYYRRQIGGFKEPYGAIWVTIYPNIMIEIYERSVVLSRVRPHDGPESRMVWKYSFCHRSLRVFPDVLDLYRQFLAEVEAEDVDLMRRVKNALYGW